MAQLPLFLHAERKQGQAAADARPHCCGRCTHDGRGWPQDFALAKRKAARQLGAEDTQALPKNEEIEAELRAYQSLYQGEEQRERIHYLRGRALEAMRLLEQFRLTSPVLCSRAQPGDTATSTCSYSPTTARRGVFPPESQICLRYLRRAPLRWRPGTGCVGAEARLAGRAAHLAIYSLKEERGTLKATWAGRPIERAGIQAVTQLLSLEGN